MKVALTGGMGCGKSAAGAFFEEFGFRRLDSDRIAHELLSRDSRVIGEVCRHFGDGVLLGGGGGIDRSALGQRVFASPEDLRWLETLLHPLIRQEWLGRVQACPQHPWIIEVPLLFENKLENLFDHSVSVFCQSTLQHSRLLARRHPPGQIKARLDRQLSSEIKAQRADVVLVNDGSLDFLKEQVASVALKLLKRFKIPS